MNRFALVGMGYVSPRHLKAIKENNGDLIAVCDTNHDVVGILDSYFPNTEYFKKESEFKSFCEKETINYLCIASPNNTHYRYAEFGLSIGANVITEKPTCLSIKEIEELINLEKLYDRNVYSVLQLRLHSEIIKLKKEIEKSDKKHRINLRYCTPRGKWYNKSWKMQEEISGGLLFNIAIHLFDILIYTCGDYKNFEVEYLDRTKANGRIELEKGEANWFVSIDPNDVLDNYPKRSLLVDWDAINLDSGFTDLHTKIYENIINGNGFGLNESRKAIELIFKLKKSYK
jgi:UDP-N-acetyl-2-amino-2-deoxyglucuronate dehydrogenase